MRGQLVFAAVLAVGVAACTDSADMVPLNQQAQATGGTPRIQFFRGVAFGPMKVTMPGGEILTGTFHISETPTAPFVPSPPDLTGELNGGGNFSATAQGPRTRLVCRANMVAGNGLGQCRSQDGALYQVKL